MTSATAASDTFVELTMRETHYHIQTTGATSLQVDIGHPCQEHTLLAAVSAVITDTAPHRRVFLIVPLALLALPWNQLMLAQQYLALQIPFVLCPYWPQDDAQPLPPTHKTRILITASKAYLEAGKRLQTTLMPVRTLADFTFQSDLSYHGLLRLFRDATTARRPFHIWHHLGQVRLDPGGVSFALPGGDFTAETWAYLHTSLHLPRLFILSTDADTAPALVSRLATLPLAGTALFANVPGDAALVTAFYQALPERHVADALLDARQIALQIDPHDAGWHATTLIARTRALTPWPVAAPPPPDITRVVFFKVNVVNLPALALDIEVRECKLVLAPYPRFMVTEWSAVRIDDIKGLLRRDNPQILHFAGHGSERYLNFINNMDLTATPLEAGDFCKLLNAYAPALQCLVLLACFSTSLLDTLRRECPRLCIVSVNDQISDQTAITFARNFYEELAGGLNLKRAYHNATIHVSHEADKFHLYEGQNADQLYFGQPRGS